MYNLGGHVEDPVSFINCGNEHGVETTTIRSSVWGWWSRVLLVPNGALMSRCWC
jgi:hypothetical protein